MRHALRFLVCCAVVAALAVPATAADMGWHLRVFAAGFDPRLDETVVNDDGDPIDVTAASDLGYGLSLEYQFSQRWGVEGGFMQGSPSVELRAEIPGYGTLSVSDSMKTTVLTFDVDLHLTPKSRSFDFYLGAGIARLSYQDLSFDVVEADQRLDVSVSNETTWSAKAGLGIALGDSRWSAAAALRYIDSGLEVFEAESGPSDSETFDFGLYNFTVGIAYSF